MPGELLMPLRLGPLRVAMLVARQAQLAAPVYPKKILSPSGVAIVVDRCMQPPAPVYPKRTSRQDACAGSGGVMLLAIPLCM